MHVVHVAHVFFVTGFWNVETLYETWLRSRQPAAGKPRRKATGRNFHEIHA